MRPKLHTAEEFLDGKIAADQEDFDDEKSVIAGANQGKSEAECDLSMITKDLAVANNNLATVDGDGDCRLLHLTMRPLVVDCCMTQAWSATLRSRVAAWPSPRRSRSAKPAVKQMKCGSEELSDGAHRSR